MNLFVEMLGVFGAISLSIIGTVIVLTLFYRGLSWLSNRRVQPQKVLIRGVLRENSWVSVRLKSGEFLERVRFAGYTNVESVQGRLPYELNNLLILEDDGQQRFLVPPGEVRMIVVLPEAASSDV